MHKHPESTQILEICCNCGCSFLYDGDGIFSEQYCLICRGAMKVARLRQVFTDLFYSVTNCLTNCNAGDII